MKILSEFRICPVLKIKLVEKATGLFNKGLTDFDEKASGLP